MSHRIRLFAAVALLALAAMAAPASATVIYFCDDVGNVGAYDDVSGIVSPVGDLSSFEVEQVIGLAWDPGTQRILLLDRSAPAVYSMDPATGVATLLFDPGFTFQGGAVSGGALYGIDEGEQTVEAFALSSFANLGLSAAAIVGHHHGLGVDAASGQVYIGGSLVDDLHASASDGGASAPLGGSSEIATVQPDGGYGTQLVTFDQNVEDIDYYDGDFLLASYDDQLWLVDGTTSAISGFLDSTQVAAGGISGPVSGVAVVGGAAPVIQEIPALSPAGLAALALVLGALAAWALRRRIPSARS